MKIIVIDGPDGVGKTTIATNVAVKLYSEYKLNTRYVHFPNYDSHIGSFIKEALYGKYGDFKETDYKVAHAMYAMDRWAWVKEHDKEYENIVIITDRYSTSSLFYQSAMELIRESKFSKQLRDIIKDRSLFDCMVNGSYNFKRLANTIKDIYKTELLVYKNPLPNISFYMDADDETIANRLNQDRKQNNEKKDSFEENDDFVYVVNTIGRFLSSGDINSQLETLSEEPTTSIQYNFVYLTNIDIDTTIDNIVQHIIKNLSITLEYIER